MGRIAGFRRDTHGSIHAAENGKKGDPQIEKRQRAEEWRSHSRADNNLEKMTDSFVCEGDTKFQRFCRRLPRGEIYLDLRAARERHASISAARGS